jgi:hypothetical protein
VAEWLNAPHSKCGIRVTVSGVRIPPSPPGANNLILNTLPWPEVFKLVGKFRGFAVPLSCGILRRDGFFQDLTRQPLVGLVCVIWWYGGLAQQPGSRQESETHNERRFRIAWRRRLARIMHHTTLFLQVMRADARRRSVRWDRREATRDAARWGLMCHIGGSAGHTAPRPMVRTA